MHDTVSVLRSLALFLIAGVCEIGGGWLVWKALRDGKPAWWSLAGAIVLILYGIIPTLQASHFGRIYPVYGGFFIVLSLLWGWGLDGNVPDRPDVIGGAIALVGVCVMMYWPRPLPAAPPELPVVAIVQPAESGDAIETVLSQKMPSSKSGDAAMLLSYSYGR